ncbi:MAG: LacI family DNA-binding transcriptional regulator [Candidatus Acidiferrales bacterium]
MNPQRVQKRKAGKAANIYDVAKKASVSVFTVSAVINKSGQVSTALQRRVEAAIRQLNYRPNLLARSLAKQRTHTIGIVVPDIANPFFPLVVRGVEDIAQKAGYSTLLCNSDNQREKEEHYLELLLSKRVDGILLTMAPGRLTPWLRRMLAEVKVPIVLVMRTSKDLKADVVLTDDHKGAFEAVTHLARIGHRRIALVSGPLEVSNGAARWKGYRKALEVHGLACDPDLIVEGDYRTESGYRAGLALLPRRPDAIFVANYLMTVGFMQAADEMGMTCPDDFGLVSFDDYPWLRCFRPRLTTIELPKYELGAKSAQLLLERISGKEGRSTIQKLAPQLRVRESCGFTLHLRNVDREAVPHDSQRDKKVEAAARPTLVREKVAGDQEGSTPTHD